MTSGVDQFRSDRELEARYYRSMLYGLSLDAGWVSCSEYWMADLDWLRDEWEKHVVKELHWRSCELARQFEINATN